MKALVVSEDIIPLGEFKTHASRVLRGLRKDGRPIVITQNGKPAAVLLAPDDFDRLIEGAGLIAAVRQGLADVEAGRIIADDELTAQLDAEFGKLE